MWWEESRWVSLIKLTKISRDVNGRAYKETSQGSTHPPQSEETDNVGGKSSYQIEINVECHLHSNVINKQKIVNEYRSLDVVSLWNNEKDFLLFAHLKMAWMIAESSMKLNMKLRGRRTVAVITQNNWKRIRSDCPRMIFIFPSKIVNPRCIVRGIWIVNSLREEKEGECVWLTVDRRKLTFCFRKIPVRSRFSFRWLSTLS